LVQSQGNSGAPNQLYRAEDNGADTESAKNAPTNLSGGVKPLSQEEFKQLNADLQKLNEEQLAKIMNEIIPDFIRKFENGQNQIDTEALNKNPEKA